MTILAIEFCDVKIVFIFRHLFNLLADRPLASNYPDNSNFLKIRLYRIERIHHISAFLPQ